MKQSIFHYLPFAGLVMLAACNGGNSSTNGNTDAASENNAGTQQAMASIEGTMPDTAVTGTAQFTQDGEKVKLNLTLQIPSKANQSVAVHLHENGDCGDQGKAAGGHWNPTNKNHGKWGSDSFHAGDIGNIELDGEGKATYEMETDLWSIGGDAMKDVVNKSVIVHNGMDDYTSQPSGNAGDRIGCGVIK